MLSLVYIYRPVFNLCVDFNLWDILSWNLICYGFDSLLICVMTDQIGIKLTVCVQGVDDLIKF